MHAEALDATKAWFQEMGKEMRIAEDQEAAELFAQQVMDQETTTNTVCVMLDSVEEDSEDEESDEEGDFSGDEGGGHLVLPRRRAWGLNKACT